MKEKDPLKQFDAYTNVDKEMYKSMDNFLGAKRPSVENDPFIQEKAFMNSMLNPNPSPAVSKHPNINKIYNAISHAETGAYQDPFIRTKVRGSGSSAYGPVQMTGGEGSMMWRLAHNPELAAEVGINNNELEYIQEFLTQADSFLDPVTDDVGSPYGYGGSGTLTSPNDMKMYENVAKKLMKYELGRVGGDMNQFLANWRGDSRDTEYFNKVKSKL
tara:strand:+ start:6705 stop:7352 length:648 start_codon:yes stop_codon:yes gene_type:complete